MQSNGNGIVFHNSDELNQSSSIGNFDNITDINIATVPFLATINDLNIGSFKLKPVSTNLSHEASSSYYLKPAKKIIIKGNSSVSYDDVSQRLDKYEEVFTPLQTLSFHQQKEINKKNLFHAHAVSVNYLATNRSQLALVFKLNSGNVTDHANGLLQQSLFSEQLRGRNTNTGAKITYNHIFKPGFFLSSHIEYQNNRAKADYSITPSGFNELLNQGMVAELLNQGDLQKNHRWHSQASVSGRIKKHQLLFSLSGKKNINELNNYIVFESSGYKRLVNPDSTNSFGLNLSEINWKMQDEWMPTKHLTLAITASTAYLHYKAATENSNSFIPSLHKLFLLPSIAATIKFSDLKRLSISYNSQTALPSVNSIMQGYAINNINSIIKGKDSLQASVTHSIQSYYSYVDLLNKGIMFFTSAIYSLRPLMLLPGQQPYNSYAVYQYFTLSRKGSFISNTTSFEKIIWKNLSRISLESNIVKGNSYSIIGSGEAKQNYLHVKEKVSIKKILKKLQINGSFEYSTTLQKMNNGVKRQYNTKQLQTATDIIWQITPKIISETSIQAYWVSPPNQSFDRFATINTILRCESKNKQSSWGMNALNLTNTRYFSLSGITQTMAFESQYRIMPIRFSVFFRHSF